MREDFDGKHPSMREEFVNLVFKDSLSFMSYHIESLSNKKSNTSINTMPSSF